MAFLGADQYWIAWFMFSESHGRTPLIWAADRGQLSAVEILLAKGAEINAQDIEGQTALHYATVCEQEAVAKYLAEHGADAKIADKEGTTPLKLCPPHWAWMQGTPT
jgi:ankyrin repeat protein